MGLEIENVVSGYTPDVDIIKGVSLRAEEGKITSIIGPNGAGKSTCLKTIYGFLTPRQGEIQWNQKDLTKADPHKMLAEGIGYLFQRRHIFPSLTVHENLKMGAWTFRGREEETEKRIQEIYKRYSVLKRRKDKKPTVLSGGEQRMLELGRILIMNPKLILVDEPTAGLAPKPAMRMYEELEELKGENVTILLVDQNVRQAIRLSDYVYIMKEGQIDEKGPTEKFEGNLSSLMEKWLI